MLCSLLKWDSLSQVPVSIRFVLETPGNPNKSNLSTFLLLCSAWNCIQVCISTASQAGKHRNNPTCLSGFNWDVAFN